MEGRDAEWLDLRRHNDRHGHNLLSRLYYDVLASGDSRLALLLPVGAVAVVVIMVLCCCTCYHRRSLVQGAGRLCAPRLRGPWRRRPTNARVSPDNQA